MRYFIYARKSTEEDDRQVLSIEAQLTELREFAAKEKLHIVASFYEAKTAKEPDRTVFGEMVSLLEKGKADGIISWHPDRLARNSVDGGKIIHLVDRGIIKAMKFPTFWFEPTPQGLFMLNISFGQSKYFVDNLRENVKRGLRQKIRNGVWPGWAPVGYTNNPTTRMIDIDHAKAPLIQKIFELYVTGAYTLPALAEECNKMGLKGKTGENISIGKVYFILQNIFYIGLMKYNGEVHEAKHQPIISKSLFDQVQKTLKDRGKPKSGKKYNFAFLGLLQCACGAGITAEQQKGHYYYRCTKKKGLCTEKHFLREEVLAEQATNYLKSIALLNEGTEYILAELEKENEQAKGQAKETVKELKIKIADIEKQLEKLLDVFLTGVLLQEEYTNRKQKLLSQKLELQEQIINFEEKGLLWIEPAKEFVLSLNKAQKILDANNIHEMTPFLKNLGSNHRLQNRRYSFIYKPPYNFVAESRQRRGKNLTFPFVCDYMNPLVPFSSKTLEPKEGYGEESPPHSIRCL